MTKFFLSKKAKSDINEIWEYTCARWPITQADRYFQLLQNEMKQLTKNPDRGRSYNQVKPGYFGVKVKSHIIFYRHRNPDVIEIIRILHERMDLRTRLGE